MPACIVEQIGLPGRACARSRDLTKGHRGKIFGLVLLLLRLPSSSAWSARYSRELALSAVGRRGPLVVVV